MPASSFPCLARLRVFLYVITLCAVAACGGGDDSAGVIPPSPQPNNPSQPPASGPVNVVGRGEFLVSAPLSVIAASDIAAALAEDGSRVRNVVPRYDVATWRIEYSTVDADGEPVVASGLVAVPKKPQGSASPVLSYQHGTIFRDAESPSNNAVPGEVSVVLASLGYVVLAPDYVGFGASKGKPHPYLLSAPTAAAVNDFLVATRFWRSKNEVLDNGQLFFTGYSEGAYATMAAHRALQESASPLLPGLLMAVMGGGPYDVQATLDGLIDVVRDKQPLLGALISPGFLRRLGGSAQREVRRAILRELLPGDADVEYDTRFLDRFFADDTRAIARDSSVNDWRPEVPVSLFHGPEDRTVPYASSVSTLNAMRSQGAADQVSLTDCNAEPSGHIQCVAPFVEFLLARIGPIATGL